MADQELHKQLPFLALPDGAHLREEDYSYFHLLLPSIAKGTIFGVSCNRQIQADQLINKGKDVTRSTVQKAIVVLASKVSSPTSSTLQRDDSAWVPGLTGCF